LKREEAVEAPRQTTSAGHAANTVTGKKSQSSLADVASDEFLNFQSDSLKKDDEEMRLVSRQLI
jgi:hypothetical protein